MHTCTKTFGGLGTQTMHNQIRYFVEVFPIKFSLTSRVHQVVFLNDLSVDIRRADLSAQHVTSLMIIAGNLLVGRYSSICDDHEEHHEQNDDEQEQEHINWRMGIVKHVVLGVLPWLSITSGFSRAIAQLLVYKLIPLVVKTKITKSDDNDNDNDNDDDDPKHVHGQQQPTSDTSNTLDTTSHETNHIVLQSIWHFLDTNPEMIRLRRKQHVFFQNYDVDNVCTPEGLFSIPTDEGCEANPVNMVDLIKNCLDELKLDCYQHQQHHYQQEQEQVEEEVQFKDSCNDNIDIINFQRKIVPIDSLNLALLEGSSSSSSKYHHQQNNKNNNASGSGRKRQGLIICATLVEKTPNIAGLVRSAEIFAAEKLVVCNIGVCKMDSFKNISVGAEEWIVIEECKEEVSSE